MEKSSFFIETMSKISAISSFVHKSIIPPSPRFSYLAVRSANMRVEILVILCIKKVMTAKAKLLSEIIISQNCTTYVPWSQNQVTQITLDLKIVIVYKKICAESTGALSWYQYIKYVTRKNAAKYTKENQSHPICLRQRKTICKSMCLFSKKKPNPRF